MRGPFPTIAALLGILTGVFTGALSSALPPVAASAGVLGAALIIGGLGGLTERSAVFVPILQVAGAVIVEIRAARARAGR